ncbi:MAG: NADH-quinone oxidoreductase subunit NuoK [Chloroflexi bacterium]|nr:NADH-quinone oxidoreductase subunit NuoK [Chloroflexota bacterium]
MPLAHVLILSAALFSLGAYAVMARRHAVLILMGIELMLNAAALNFIAFAVYLDPNFLIGMMFGLFVIVVAAAEVGLALAIILHIHRTRSTANADDLSLMKW